VIDGGFLISLNKKNMAGWSAEHISQQLQRLGNIPVTMELAERSAVSQASTCI
jgi:hypothetical protein